MWWWAMTDWRALSGLFAKRWLPDSGASMRRTGSSLNIVCELPDIEGEDMTMNRRLIATIVCVLALLANVVGVVAQAAQEKRRPPTEVMVQAEGQPRVWVGGGTGQMATAQGDN